MSVSQAGGGSSLIVGSPGNGLSISAGAITLAAAGASQAGAVTTAAQTFAGVKAFPDGLTIGTSPIPISQLGSQLFINGVIRSNSGLALDGTGALWTMDNAGGTTFSGGAGVNAAAFTATAGGITMRNASAAFQFGIAGTGYIFMDAATAAMYFTNGSWLGFNNHLAFSSQAPTISSGFGTSPAIVASNGTAAFTIDVGTGGVASTGVIGLPNSATTGWAVTVRNLTNPDTSVTRQTATTTGSASVKNYSATTGAPAAWAASDILLVTAVAY